MPKGKITKATSRCGLDCNKCSAYIATVTNDDALREKTATEWNEKYNAPGCEPITENDIRCLGCLSVIEPIYKHCKECSVRVCGLEKNVQNCGECLNYKICPKIASLHKQIPEGKKVCDEVNKIN